jgi:hypothetical protein
MKRLFIQLNVAIFLLSVFSFRSLGADRYTLEFKLEKGKICKQRTVSDFNMTMNAMGQEMKVNVKSEICMHYEVTGQNNDVYDIQVAYQKIKTNMSSLVSFIIDSDFPENSSDKNVGEVFQSLIGIPIDIQLTKEGKVISVKGTNRLAEKLDAITNEQFRQMFGQQFSEKAIQTSLEQLSPYFPAKPVAVDESWDVTININSGGFDITNAMKLTLTEVNDKVATLECTGTLTTPEGGVALQIQGMKANVSTNGELSGTIRIDMKTGWIVRSEITTNLMQNIEVMGQTLPQKIETKTIVTAD